MKQVTGLLRIMLIAVSMAVSVAPVAAQESKKQKKEKKEDAITALIQNQNYVFKAQNVMPMGGGTRQLTSEYDVRVTKDTVVSFLPYFGRAYGYVDPNNGGIQFTSTNFTYTITDKKNGWDILIKPTDAKSVQQMSFSIFNNGSATLQVISNNRQPISFNGFVTEIKPGKK